MKTHQSHPDTMTAISILQGSIEKIIGSDFIEKSQVLPDSKLSEDLKMDQFDISHLREDIFLNFGRNCDLFGYFHHLDIDQIINLKVGDIAGFVENYKQT